MQRLKDLLDILNAANFFSELHIRSIYHKIQIRPSIWMKDGIQNPIRIILVEVYAIWTI